MKSLLFVYFLMIGLLPLCKAHPKTDTLQSWMSKFFTIANMEQSPDGKWVTIKKRYGTNNDTLLIFNSRNPNFPARVILNTDMGGIFLKNDLFVASGNSTATLYNLKNNEKTVYKEVEKAGGLASQDTFFILRTDGNLDLYNSNGKLARRFSNILKYATDGENRLFLCRKSSTANEIISIADPARKALYSTVNEITWLELSASGQYIIITERDNETSKLKVTFIDSNKGNVANPMASSFVDANFIKVTEIQDGKAFLLDFQSYSKPLSKMTVDMWYGNDSKIREKKYGTTDHKYILWKPERNEVFSISTDRFPIFSSNNNDRFLLAFNPTEDFNYVFPYPLLNIHLYDTLQNTYRAVFNQSSNIVASQNGAYIIGYINNGNKWQLFHTESGATYEINKAGLKNPVFASDGRSIFFENHDDIWKYDIEYNELKATTIATGKETKIINVKHVTLDGRFNIKVRSINSELPILIKTTDSLNRTSYIAWQGGNLRKIISDNQNNIKEIKYTANLKSILSIEENYNLPPTLVSTNLKQKRTIYKGNINDIKAPSLKQSIIHFSNSAGKSLKGVLYFPTNFNPEKKHPMIVNIYQIQSPSANFYSAPEYSPVGYNRRILLERGYLVFQPDIVYDKRGTGISALDCVNSALDALADKPYINFKKLGLTGHSQGGYETNFIATHSDRFATYITGAGHSDIIRAYFSYSYQYSSPFYWQFETQQYEMNVPFSENKELYFRNNPIHYVEKVNAPMLLWTGLKDENVRWDHTMEFYVGLKRNHKQVIAMFYPGKTHDVGRGTKESADLNKRILEWWDYFLKEKTDVPWINKQIKEDASASSPF